MSSRAMLPLIDLVFLTLGSIVAVMTQMRQVKALPVELAEVGAGAAVVRADTPAVLGIDAAGGLTLDGAAITRGELSEILPARSVLVRADRRLPTDALLQVLAEAVRAGADVALEVEERADSRLGSSAP